MCVISLCTRGALDAWSRGRSTAALGVMAASCNSVAVRRALLGGGALILPPAIVAVYLLFSRQDLRFSAAGDYLALLAAIAVGAICLWHLVGRAGWRPIAMVVYPLVCFFALVMFSLSFLCAVFQECL